MQSVPVFMCLSMNPQMLTTELNPGFVRQVPFGWFRDASDRCGNQRAQVEQFWLLDNNQIRFDGDSIEQRARGVVEQMALAMQGSLLARHAPPEVADAFCVTRLREGGPGVFGTLPPDPSGFRAIIDRHRPVPLV